MEHPAAWHPDPTGLHDHRWWDGTRWTEHVADAGVSSIDPLPAAPGTASAETAATDTSATATAAPTDHAQAHQPEPQAAEPQAAEPLQPEPHAQDPARPEPSEPAAGADPAPGGWAGSAASAPDPTPEPRSEVAPEPTVGDGGPRDDAAADATLAGTATPAETGAIGQETTEPRTTEPETTEPAGSDAAPGAQGAATPTTPVAPFDPASPVDPEADRTAPLEPTPDPTTPIQPQAGGWGASPTDTPAPASGGWGATAGDGPADHASSDAAPTSQAESTAGWGATPQAPAAGSEAARRTASGGPTWSPQTAEAPRAASGELPAGVAAASLVVAATAIPLAPLQPLAIPIGGIVALIAIGLAIVGMQRAKRGTAGGRGLAIGGLVTGLVALVLTIVLAVTYWQIRNELDDCIERTGNESGCQDALYEELIDRFVPGA